MKQQVWSKCSDYGADGGKTRQTYAPVVVALEHVEDDDEKAEGRHHLKPVKDQKM